MNALRLPPLDQLIKAIPLLTGYLVFLGIANAILYYDIFDINILRYVSLSEAILFSLDYFIFFCVVLIFAFFITDLLPETTKNRILALAGAKDIEKEETDLPKNMGLVFRRTLYGKMVLVAILLIFTILHRSRGGWIMFGLLVLTMAGISFSLRVCLRYIQESPAHRGIRIVLLFGLVLTTLFITWSKTTRAVLLKYGPQTERVLIHCKDNQVYQTSDSLLYVGKVDRFLFLYNRALQEPEVIAAEDAVHIQWFRQ